MPRREVFGPRARKGVNEPAGQTATAARQARLERGTEAGMVGAAARLAHGVGTMAARTNLGGEQSPWKNRVSVAGNGWRHYGLVGGATP